MEDFFVGTEHFILECFRWLFVIFDMVFSEKGCSNLSDCRFAGTHSQVYSQISRYVCLAEILPFACPSVHPSIPPSQMVLLESSANKIASF